MAMAFQGLVKLSEEAAEVIQVAQKLVAYPSLTSQAARDEGWTHPDGTHLTIRLQEEIGDVLAAIEFVAGRLRLDRRTIEARRVFKLALFEQWDKEP